MAAPSEHQVITSKRSPGVTAPPEGSWGWVVVAGCFLAIICNRAVTRCVSMFFVEFQLHFESDYSTTSWIHSLIDCTTMLCAPLGSLIGNRFSCRAAIMLGGLLACAGLVFSSFVSHLEYLYIFLGMLTGLGFALSYTPAIAMVGTYFDERKALAYGIAMSGAGIGTFVLAPLVQLLIESYSWRGALLILGGFVSNLCVCGALMRPLRPSRHERTTLFDSNDVVAPKLPGENISEKEELHIANESLTINELEITPSNSPLPGPEKSGEKAADCIVFTNTLTERMLREIKLSDPRTLEGSTMEDLKMLEDMNRKGEVAAGAGTVGPAASGVVEGLLGGHPENPADKTELPRPVRTRTFSLSCCSGLKPRRDFGFLLMPDFLILSISILFMAYACSTPVVHLVPYAISVGAEHHQAAFLVSIFGISGIVGNITFGWITDRKCLRRYRLLSYMIAVSMEGLCCIFLPFLCSFNLLVPFAILYGYFDGAYVTLIPVVTSDVVSPTYLTSALGVIYFLHSIPYLVSPPIGGWLVDRTGNYTATFLVCGVSYMISAVILGTGISVRRCQRSTAR